jgi:hypothetical protein
LGLAVFAAAIVLFGFEDEDREFYAENVRRSWIECSIGTSSIGIERRLPLCLEE